MSPIVILVWGYAFYKLFGSFFATPNYAKPITNEVINIEEIQKDTFDIVANYRDPFLGEKPRQKQVYSSNNQSNKPKTVKIEKKAEQPWPTITYKGMIKNNNSDRRVGIAMINGKEYLVKQGDEIQSVKFMAIGKQTIEVSFQKEKKTITK